MTAKENYKKYFGVIGFNKEGTTINKSVCNFAEDYLNEYANWKRNVNINVDSYPEVVLIEMFKEDNS